MNIKTVTAGALIVAVAYAAWTLLAGPSRADEASLRGVATVIQGNTE